MADSTDVGGSVASGAEQGASAGSVAGPYGAVIGGVIGAGTGLVSGENALEAQQAALQQIQALNNPSAAQLSEALQQEQVQGQINPQMEALAQQGPNAMAGISTDPRLAQAQYQALAQLQQSGNTGLTAANQAAVNQISQTATGNANAMNAATLQNLAARGMAGSGNELAAKLASSQGAANQLSQQGMNVAGMANNAALQAISQSGQLGAGMQAQSFGQQAQTAQAQNAINQFNTANRQAVANANTGAANQAQYANLGNAQNVANANTGIANTQANYNAQMQQQAYIDAANKTQMGATQGNAVAKTTAGLGQQTAGAIAGMGQGIDQIANASGSSAPATPSSANYPNASNGYGSMTPLPTEPDPNAPTSV
jgi:hypothetical protein